MFSFFTIFLVAISLSMDTFSLSLIYGTLGLESRKINILSILVGVFHFFMPLFGNLVGFQLLKQLPFSAQLVVGIIFILIAMQMLMQNDTILDLKKISSFFLFSFTVSLDSFSVGIAISEITNNYIIAYLVFALTSTLFTFIGLKFGTVISSKYGNNATKVGSLILVILGILYILK